MRIFLALALAASLFVAAGCCNTCEVDTCSPCAAPAPAPAVCNPCNGL